MKYPALPTPPTPSRLASKPALTKSSLCLLGLAASICLPTLSFAAFGVVTSANNYVVDTDAGLVFKINKNNGDLVSLNYKGKELQDQSKFSGIASGLGSATVTTQEFGSDRIRIACTTAILTHYYIAKKGESTVYMATYTKQEPAVGELRYIARLSAAQLPHGNPASDLSGNDKIVEGKDVFHLPNGETRSKFYSAVAHIDGHVWGATGTNVGAFMVISANGYEASSGGPFFKDINNQEGGQQEIYFYMNSGHAQTDSNRMGLHGPYALAVTSGGTPSASLDMSWLSGLGLTGWVANRGNVTGTVSGIPSGVEAVVGWANSTAQYWARASGGTFTSPPMIPGTYTMTLYKNELNVANTSVTVGTGTTTKSIASAEPKPAVIWEIGTFDGTPEGFLNAKLQPTMHPSDKRMAAWKPTTFTIGDAVSTFPMAQFQLVNSPTKIVFTLSSAQVKAHTLRIGTTVAFGGGRPQIKVNPGTSHAFTGPTPAAPKMPYGRSLTRGVYHGYYNSYSVNIPASAFIAGKNTIEIDVSGNGPYGGFLSASFAYDAVALEN